MFRVRVNLSFVRQFPVLLSVTGDWKKTGEKKISFFVNSGTVIIFIIIKIWFIFFLTKLKREKAEERKK